ncbi:V-type ATPase subunit [Peptoniphilus sp. MSJ-1]|uniref:V-type ATPase subunit n=1 Tax=Peptoniphilus ovalis TaxID=2841503 RepID=A0ABS6FEZ3_9FIRM|nr:V-type ATPase subunit [Peptoniphilus ovalis]MBU5668751.1 V-type ATPase subunit [Peptoniphilus ovalis]
MFSGLDALNAKLQKMFSNFLDFEDYKALSQETDLKGCLRFLKNKNLKEIDSFSDIYEIEKFLEDYRRNEITRLKGFLPIKYIDFMKAYLLRIDIDKISNILRSLKMNRDPKVSDLIIRGRKINFKDETISSFVDDLKGTKYFEYLKNYKDSDAEDILFSMEMNLDKFYYLNLVEATKSFSNKDREEFREIFGVNIDLLNIIWIYRAKRYYDISPEEIFNFTIFGGNYTSEKLLHFSYLTEEEFEEEILKSKYKVLFYNRKIKSGRTAKRYLYATARANFRSSKGIGKFMSYLILLDIEISNIERMLEAARFGIEPNEKLKYLIIDREGSEEFGR